MVATVLAEPTALSIARENAAAIIRKYEQVGSLDSLVSWFLATYWDSLSSIEINKARDAVNSVVTK